MTNSEWDNGDFAIIYITGEWKETQKKRLEAVKPLGNDYNLKKFVNGLSLQEKCKFSILKIVILSCKKRPFM